MKLSTETYRFKLTGENVEAHPAGCLFLLKEKILLLADLHLGKISHFRKYGSAITAEAAKSDYKKLTDIVTYYQPEKLLFLGDLFHSDYNSEFLLFKEWKERYPELDVRLILGNHDIIDTQNFSDIGIKIQDEYFMKNLFLTHHPEDKEGYLNICGHIHPGFTLNGFGGQRTKLRCFYWKKNQLILPAFGNFTGKFLIKPQKGETVLIMTDNAVFPLKS